MIPKKIHYCWFGGNPLPQLALKCIESWKKYCPDYEIIEWNESNYDVHKNKYMSQAYENKKWGFVPDYARLDIIYEHGGIYLDTDVEIIKPLDGLLELEAFAGVEHNSEYVALGLGFGAHSNNPTIKAIRDYYNSLLFVKNGELDITPAPKVNNVVLKELGYIYSEDITKCDSLTVFPSEYFCPMDYITGETDITDNTVSIHHYTSSWYDEEQSYALSLKKKYIKFLPRNIAAVCAVAVSKLKYKGPKACIMWILKKRR